MRHTTRLLRLLLIGVLSLVSAGMPGVVSAGTNVWTTSGPESGWIYTLAIDPATPTTVYAGTGGSRVFERHRPELQYGTYLPLILRGR